MTPTTKSPFAHGRSEIWDKAAISKAIAGLNAQMALRLREIRLKKGISQELASEMIGIHPKHLQRLERGVTNVTVGTLAAISVAYEVPIKELFDPPARPNPTGRVTRKDARANGKKPSAARKRKATGR